MKRQSLKETNPYFKDREKREKILEVSANSSCAVEGIVVSSNQKALLIPAKKSKAAYQRIKNRLSK